MLSKFRIKCIEALFFIEKDEEFYYDSMTDEYFNEKQSFSGKLARENFLNFKNIE